MRKILLIDGGKVTPLNETRFGEEGKLQDYLEEYPTLIPLADIVEGASQLVCVGREVGTGSGSIDLLCIDKDGVLTIVETKLRRNREARREVLGQIIEYASYVSQWTADDVYRVINEYFFAKSQRVPLNHQGKPIDEVMKEIVGDEFSGEDFRAKIGQNLRDGRIRLIIAVDELIEPLRVTVTFLNSYSNFDILLLQVTDFEESETKRVLVPLLFGYATKSAERGSREFKHWDEASFLADAKTNCEPEVADTTMRLYDFTVNNAEISWGKGATYGSFTFRKSRHGIPVSIFTINSVGSGYICFGQLAGVGVKAEILQALRAKLNEIPGISIPVEAVELGKFPSFALATLTEPENLRNFQDAVLVLCREIES